MTTKRRLSIRSSRRSISVDLAYSSDNEIPPTPVEPFSYLTLIHVISVNWFHQSSSPGGGATFFLLQHSFILQFFFSNHYIIQCLSSDIVFMKLGRMHIPHTSFGCPYHAREFQQIEKDKDTSGMNQKMNLTRTGRQ